MKNNFNCARCNKAVNVDPELNLEQQPHVLFGVGAECFKSFVLDYKERTGTHAEPGPMSRDDLYASVLPRLLGEMFPQKDKNPIDEVIERAFANMYLIKSLEQGEAAEKETNYYLEIAKAELDEVGFSDDEKAALIERFEEARKLVDKVPMAEEQKRAIVSSILEEATGVQFPEEDLIEVGDYKPEVVALPFSKGAEPNFVRAQTVGGLQTEVPSEIILLNSFINSAVEAAQAAPPAVGEPVMALKDNGSYEGHKEILADFGYGIHNEDKYHTVNSILRAQVSPLVRKSDSSIKMFLNSQKSFIPASKKDAEIYKRAADTFNDFAKLPSPADSTGKLSWSTVEIGSKMLSLAVNDENVGSHFGVDSFAPTAFYPIAKGAHLNGDADALLISVKDNKINLSFRKRDGRNPLQEIDVIAKEKGKDLASLAQDEKLFLVTVSPKGACATFAASFSPVDPTMKKIRGIDKTVKVGDQEYTTVVTKTFNNELDTSEVMSEFQEMTPEHKKIYGNMFHSYSPYRKQTTGEPCVFPAASADEIKTLKSEHLKTTPEPESMYHLVARSFDSIRAQATSNE